MTDVKVSWQETIETATGPNSAVAQLLNARMFDLEAIVLAQAQRIDDLERQQTANFDALQTSLQKAVRTISRELREDFRQSKKRGLIR